jgi:hypothetical protein
VIFQFKTDVKLKYGCVEPLIHINFRWLLKTAKNSPIISSAASRKPSKIDQKYFQRPRNFWRFCVVIFSGQGIFGDRFEPPKISLFLAKKNPENGPYFQLIIFGGIPPLKIGHYRQNSIFLVNFPLSSAATSSRKMIDFL